MESFSKSNMRTQPPSLNLAPLFLRDVEDLTRLAKENTGTHAENLFTRAAIIFAVIALDHFIDLYLERISAADTRASIKNQIETLRRDRKVGSLRFPVQIGH